MGSQFGITHDTEHKARIDGLAIFYAVLSGLWSICIVAGMVFLYRRRDSPILRIRGILLSICAVGFLHLYWVSVQFGYMYGPIMPPEAEYWLMSTWLPFGIAFFHASNTRFLHVARAQRRFVVYEKINDKPQQGRAKGLLERFRRMDHTRKVFVLVGAGMVLQVGSPERHIPVTQQGWLTDGTRRYSSRDSCSLSPASFTARGAFPGPRCTARRRSSGRWRRDMAGNGWCLSSCGDRPMC